MYINVYLKVCIHADLCCQHTHTHTHTGIYKGIAMGCVFLSLATTSTALLRDAWLTACDKTRKWRRQQQPEKTWSLPRL
ncbi:hypothetical protein Micbo1qcDRAFT_156872, partial [Microdochium bolleyi]